MADVELSPLEKARLQGRAEAIETIAATLRVSRESFLRVADLLDQNFLSESETTQLLRNVLTDIMESALELAEIHLSIKQENVIAKSGIPVSIMRVNKESFRNLTHKLSTQVKF